MKIADKQHRPAAADTQPAPLAPLPDELQTAVFRYLTLAEKRRYGRVCRQAYGQVAHGITASDDRRHLRTWLQKAQHQQTHQGTAQPTPPIPRQVFAAALRLGQLPSACTADLQAAATALAQTNNPQAANIAGRLSRAIEVHQPAPAPLATQPKSNTQATPADAPPSAYDIVHNALTSAKAGNLTAAWEAFLIASRFLTQSDLSAFIPHLADKQRLNAWQAFVYQAADDRSSSDVPWPDIFRLLNRVDQRTAAATVAQQALTTWPQDQATTTVQLPEAIAATHSEPPAPRPLSPRLLTILLFTTGPAMTPPDREAAFAAWAPHAQTDPATMAGTLLHPLANEALAMLLARALQHFAETVDGAPHPLPAAVNQLILQTPSPRIASQARSYLKQHPNLVLTPKVARHLITGFATVNKHEARYAYATPTMLRWSLMGSLPAPQVSQLAQATINAIIKPDGHAGLGAHAFHALRDAARYLQAQGHPAQAAELAERALSAPTQPVPNRHPLDLDALSLALLPAQTNDIQQRLLDRLHAHACRPGFIPDTHPAAPLHSLLLTAAPQVSRDNWPLLLDTYFALAPRGLYASTVPQSQALAQAVRTLPRPLRRQLLDRAATILSTPAVEWRPPIPHDDHGPSAESLRQLALELFQADIAAPAAR